MTKEGFTSSNMKCLKCNGKVFMNGFCKSHFIENIEKRVKKDIRRNNLIKKNETLVVKDPLCGYFISRVLNIPVKMAEKGKGREILFWTMDDEVLAFLTALFSRRKMKNGSKKIIKLLRTVKDKELEAYAKLKKIRCRIKRSRKEKNILDEIDRLEEKHMETRFSLLKSIEELSRL